MKIKILIRSKIKEKAPTNKKNISITWQWNSTNRNIFRGTKKKKGDVHLDLCKVMFKAALFLKVKIKNNLNIQH